MSTLTLHVDAALSVRDGFTGAPLAPGALQCAVDGRPYRPVTKNGGYFVFAGLTPGEHVITLRGARYREELVRVMASGRACAELAVTMKPAENYPFGAAVTWLTLAVTRKGAPEHGAVICLAVEDPLREIRIAQDEAPAGETQCRLFCRVSALAALPANCLLPDGKETEIAVLSEISGDMGFFARPLAYAHKRGRSLYPAQLFTAGLEGVIRAVFSEPVRLRLYSPETGAAAELSLTAGENRADFSL